MVLVEVMGVGGSAAAADLDLIAIYWHAGTSVLVSRGGASASSPPDSVVVLAAGPLSTPRARAPVPLPTKPLVLQKRVREYAAVDQ